MTTRLRPFQDATVVAATRALRGRGRRRYLVADEVGLGKTIVARETLRQLSKGGAAPFVVYYVTSNTRVSDQNAKRLVDFLGDKASDALSKVDRLGLIPLEGMRSKALRLYPLSPITSFPAINSRPQTGRAGERACLSLLLERCYPGITKALPRSFLRQRAVVSWDAALDRATQLVRAVPRKFVDAYRSALVREFGHGARRRIENAVASDASPLRTLARLRRSLSEACLIAMPPDLLIFDEFQRFRELLRPPSGDRLVEALLHGPANGRPPPMLLLSATPYRLFGEIWDSGASGGSHIELLDLIQFLGGDRARTAAEALFLDFAGVLRAIGRDDSSEIDPALHARARDIRDDLESVLRPIIARTERHAHVVRADGTDQPELGLEAIDLEVFRHFADGVAPKMKAAAVPYWLSVPLPAQALGGRYKITQHVEFKAARGVPAITPLRRARSSGWGNAKLRRLGRMAPCEDLALPWSAPSLCWWPLGGAWLSMPSPKALLFSRFRATPQSVAALVSLDVERRYAGEASQSYEQVWKRRKLQAKAGKIRTLALFHPSPLLIAATDPLAGRHATAGRARQTVRQQLVKALREAGVAVRRRPLAAARRRLPGWHVLAAVEKSAGCFDTGQAAWTQIAASDGILGDLLDQRGAVEPLEWVSPRELDDLAAMALGGPAVVAGRAWGRHYTTARDPDALASLVRFAWKHLRPYLDTPIFWGRLGSGKPTRVIQAAVIDGGFESLLDEQFWLARGRVKPEALVDDLADALSAMTGWFTFKQLPARAGDIRVRCHAAVPFGGTETADEPVATGNPARPARSHELRRAFNTPFWPHVLATTSVAQEGLDFHSWCERIVHWDLPSNPVDLEQREGRVSRFAGLAVRRPLAREVGPAALRSAAAGGGSPWRHIERLAEESHCDASGLSPWWRLEGADIRRSILSLPQSRDIQRFKRLQKQRLLYRLALGQPDQEDLVELLSRAEDAKVVLLHTLTIDLSPFSMRTTETTESEVD